MQGRKGNSHKIALARHVILNPSFKLKKKKKNPIQHKLFIISNSGSHSFFSLPQIPVLKKFKKKKNPIDSHVVVPNTESTMSTYHNRNFQSRLTAHI